MQSPSAVFRQLAARFTLLTVSSLAWAAPSQAVDPVGEIKPNKNISIPVPSDPKAQYYLVELKRNKANNAVITTRRNGPSGTSYAKREVDCDYMQFRYLADGDSWEEFKASKVEQDMAALTDESISWYVANFSCTHGPWPK